MKYYLHSFAFAVLVALLIIGGNRPAKAGRLSGPETHSLTLQPNEAKFILVPFDVGNPAIVSAASLGIGDIELSLYDEYGQHVAGVGTPAFKTARMDMYFRPGIVKIVVQNKGPGISTVRVKTN